MTAIIFGANGQDGSYLAELLQQRGMHVVGISRSGNWLRTDITDYEAVKAVITMHQPQYIFHLAANSTTRHDVIFENNNTIGTGSLNILEAVRTASPHTKVFLSGSGLQFQNQGRPIKETDPFDASSPYAVSRIQTLYAARYFRTLGVQTYFGYFFNHESPIRPERHMSRKIASAARRIQAGSNEILEIGDITVKKEWTYAGDVVKAIMALVEQNNIFESNLGSGLAYSIEEWLEVCFGLIGKDWRQHVTLKQNFVPEYDILVSDPARIHSLGWMPKVSFTGLAEMMMAN